MKAIIKILLVLGLINNVVIAGEKFLVKEESLNGLETKYYDLNGDEKIDRIEFWRGGFLEKLQVDRFFSGQINEWTQYFAYKNDLTPIELIEKDSNKDGIADRKQTVYQNEKNKIWLTVNEVDSDFNGSFEKKYNTHTEIMQRKDQQHCDPEALKWDSKFLTLAQQSQNIGTILDKEEYLKTSFGYKIQNECMKNWGTGFPEMLRESITTGMKCLQKLGRDNESNKVSPNGAFFNFKNLDHIISNQGVTIACNQKDYSWKGTSAHASVKANEQLKELGITHPFMSLNPNDPKEKGKGSKDETDYLKKTLFHEQLHNLGILHGDDIEAPYTCETCCFPEGTEKAEVEAACKVCSGGYQGARDKNYIKDMIAWSQASYNRNRGLMAVNNYQKEFPQERFGLLAFAELSTDVFSPVGADIAKIMKQRFNDLQPEEVEKIAKLESFSSYELFKSPKIKKSSSILANAYVLAVFDQDPKKMLNLIQKERMNLRSMLDEGERAEKRDGNEKYVLQGMKDQLRSILTDVWLKDPPGQSTPESSAAYDLLREFKLLRKM